MRTPRSSSVTAFATVLVAATATSSALAADAPEAILNPRAARGVTLGLSTGALVLSTNEKDVGLTMSTPVRLDVLARVSPKLDLGAFAELGPIWMTSIEGSPPAKGFRGTLGALSAWHPSAGSAPIDPWLAFGLGFEGRAAKQAYDDLGVSYNRFGVLGRLSFGIDVRFGSRFALAPFVEGTAGTYFVDPGAQYQHAGVSEAHASIGAGLRASLDL